MDASWQDDPKSKPKIKLRIAKNGTNGGRLVVNNVEVEESPLNHGDRIVFGRAFAFRLVMPGEPAGNEDGSSASTS